MAARLSTPIGQALSVLVLVFAPAGAAAEPTVVYDGFGAASTFDNTTFAAFGKVEAAGRLSDADLAISFTNPLSQLSYLHAIDLAVTSLAGHPGMEVRILGSGQDPDEAGLPQESLVLERMTVFVPRLDDQAGPPGPSTITHLLLTQGPALRPGARYWLALSASRPVSGPALAWWGARADTGGVTDYAATRSNLGPWRPVGLPGRGLAARIVVTPAPTPTARQYTFTKITDTHGPFRAFPRPGLVALTNAGTTVFRGETDAGSEGIFSGSAGTFTTVAESGHGLAEFARLDPFPSVNAGGLVVWGGTLRGGPEGIFTRHGSSLASVVDAPGPFHSFGHPTVNAAGAVAFLAGMHGRGGGVFVAKTGTIGAVAHTDGPFDGFLARPSMNDKGTVAFGAHLDTGETGIYAWRPGSPLTTIAETSGRVTGLRAPSLNNRGTVAFHACLDAVHPDCPAGASASQGLFAGNGGALVQIADTSGPFDTLGNPTLNNVGQAVFLARLDSGRRGIYTGPDVARDKVLVTGDSLFGSEVTDLGFFHGLGFNDAGQIAFYASLQNGTEGIFLAIPAVPIQ